LVGRRNFLFTKITKKILKLKEEGGRLRRKEVRILIIFWGGPKKSWKRKVRN